VQKVLQLTEDKRRAWEKAWDDQKRRLEQNFQVCQFRFDLKQVTNKMYCRYCKIWASKPRGLIETQRLLVTRRLLEHWPRAPCVY